MCLWGEVESRALSSVARYENFGGVMIMRRKISKAPLCLGDLILAVSSYADSQEETVATVADLLASGQVRLMNNGRKIRARVR